MPLASSGTNIRFNGTGRAYVAAVGSVGVGMEVGEMDGLSDSYSKSEDKIKSNRTAARATIATVNNETEVSLSFGMREQSVENLEMAYSANPANTTSQLAGDLEGIAVTMVDKEYADLGKLDCTIIKIGHGTITGDPLQIGETISGATSSATGKIAWVGSGYVELIAVSGTFSSGEKVTGSVSSGSAHVSSVEKLADMVVCDAKTNPTKRYELEKDYRVDADYGYLMPLPGGGIGDTAYVSCDHEAAEIKEIHALSAGDVEKKLTFVSDAGDNGPRMRFTYWRVKLSLNGDNQKIGDGESVLSMNGTVMADTSKPTDQQYVKVEIID